MAEEEQEEQDVRNKFLGSLEFLAIKKVEIYLRIEHHTSSIPRLGLEGQDTKGQKVKDVGLVSQPQLQPS